MRERPSLAVWIATVIVALSCGGALVSGANRLVVGGRGESAAPLAVAIVQMVLAVFLAGCQYLAAFRRRWPHALVVAGLFGVAGVVMVTLGDAGSALQTAVGAAHLFAAVVMGRWGWRLLRLRREQRAADQRSSAR